MGAFCVLDRFNDPFSVWAKLGSFCASLKALYLIISFGNMISCSKMVLSFISSILDLWLRRDDMISNLLLLATVQFAIGLMILILDGLQFGMNIIMFEDRHYLLYNRI